MSGLNLDTDFGDAGEPISVEDALRILSKRMGKVQTETYAYTEESGQSVAMHNMNTLGGQGAGLASMGEANRMELARRIVSAMPEELRTKAVLEQGDIRPLLAMAATPLDKLNDEDKKVGGQSFTPEMQRLANAYLTGFTNNRTSEHVKALVKAGMSPEEAQITANESSSLYKAGTITRAPMIQGSITGVDAEGDVTLSSDASTDLQGALGFDVNAGLNGEAGATELKYMTTDEILELLRTTDAGDPELQQLMDYEASLKQSANAGVDELGNPISVSGAPMRVAYEQGQRPQHMAQLPSGVSQDTIARYKDTAGGTKSYGLSEVVKLPTTMSRGEVATLSKKLENAGFYEQVGAKPQRMDDPYDPVFKRAWRLLVSRSIERQEPVLSVLNDATASYKEAMEDSLAVSLTDPARIRTTTNAIGQSMLGRKLRPEEQSQLVEFVHNLERRNARIEKGLDPDGDVDTDEEMIKADIDAQLEEMMRAENPVEAGAHDVAAQYDTFTTLLRGPGRGI